MRKLGVIVILALLLVLVLAFSAQGQYSTDPIGAGYYDSWIPPIVFESGWTNTAFAGPYLGAVANTNTFGARAVFSIWGDAITIYYTKGSAGGVAEICVDSTLGPICGDVDMYNATTTNLNAISFTFLGPGFHDVVIQKKTNNTTYIWFDAFMVHPPPYATPEPIEVVLNITLEAAEVSVSITQQPPAYIHEYEMTIGEESRQVAFDYRLSTGDVITVGMMLILALMGFILFVYMVFFGRAK